MVTLYVSLEGYDISDNYADVAPAIYHKPFEFATKGEANAFKLGLELMYAATQVPDFVVYDEKEQAAWQADEDASTSARNGLADFLDSLILPRPQPQE